MQHVDGIVEGISEEDCMEVKGKEPHTFFVTDQFDGPVFEHLREKRCR